MVCVAFYGLRGYAKCLSWYQFPALFVPWASKLFLRFRSLSLFIHSVARCANHGFFSPARSALNVAMFTNYSPALSKCSSFQFILSESFLFILPPVRPYSRKCATHHQKTPREDLFDGLPPLIICPENTKMFFSPPLSHAVILTLCNFAQCAVMQ